MNITMLLERNNMPH